MAHTCHATGCPVHVPPRMFMCKSHWFSLPKHMRDAIWRTYREGQCDDWKISHAYANAARAAVIYIAEREGREPDIRLYNILDPVKPLSSPEISPTQQPQSKLTLKERTSGKRRSHNTT